MTKPSILYLAYDAATEPLAQSQVLSYLRPLSRDFRVHLITHEKTPIREARREVGDSMQGINWHPHRYHKRPSALATGGDILSAIAHGAALVKRHNISVVHARSYVPAAIASGIKRLTGTPYVFDMRGFWADERIEGGLWAKDSRLYQVTKQLEDRFLREAGHIISLTEAAVKVLRHQGYREARYSVIPTCVDLERFVRSERQRENLQMVYVGSAGTWYDFDAVARTARILQEKSAGAEFRVLNRSEHDTIFEALNQHNVDLERVHVAGCPHAEMPGALAAASFGVFYYRNGYSRAACSPTKLGEMLACGIPVITSEGVGDVPQIIRDNRVGVVTRGTTDAELTAGLEELLSMIQGDSQLAERCRATAERIYSLSHGVDKISQIYASLLSR